MRKEKSSFTASFGGMFVVKEKSVPVLIEFVPTSHNPDALAENRKIEHDSRIEENTLQSTRWIKPVQRWDAGQLMTHIIMWFSLENTANQAIWDCVVISRKRVWEPNSRTEAPNFNFRATDWDDFKKALASRLGRLEAGEEFHTKGELYDWLDKLTQAVRDIVEEKVPRVKPSPYMKQWWNEGLAEKCKEVHRLA